MDSDSCRNNNNNNGDKVGEEVGGEEEEETDDVEKNGKDENEEAKDVEGEATEGDNKVRKFISILYNVKSKAYTSINMIIRNDAEFGRFEAHFHSIFFSFASKHFCPPRSSSPSF